MRIVKEPTVYFIASSQLEEEGEQLEKFLDDIGDPNWYINDDISDGENIIEAGGRMCYRSWQAYDPEMPLATNPNVTKVREGNDIYLANVLKSRHGSILEHISASFIFRDVSRVFTHELTRHRAGMAYSQESLRYVRLDDLSFWIPDWIRENIEANDLALSTIKYLENVQKKFAEIYKIKDIKSFQTKKQMTSGFRRFAPIGLGTSILATGNLRSWRHVIEMRTSEHAEEEIRLVFGKVANTLKDAFPNVFQDMNVNNKGEWLFENQKV